MPLSVRNIHLVIQWSLVTSVIAVQTVLYLHSKSMSVDQSVSLPFLMCLTQHWGKLLGWVPVVFVIQWKWEVSYTVLQVGVGTVRDRLLRLSWSCSCSLWTLRAIRRRGVGRSRRARGGRPSGSRPAGALLSRCCRRSQWSGREDLRRWWSRRSVLRRSPQPWPPVRVSAGCSPGRWCPPEGRGGAGLAAGGSGAASGDGMKVQLLPLKQPYWADREHEPGFPIPVKDTHRKVGWDKLSTLHSGRPGQVWQK